MIDILLEVDPKNQHVAFFADKEWGTHAQTSDQLRSIFDEVFFMKVPHMGTI